MTQDQYFNFVNATLLPCTQILETYSRMMDETMAPIILFRENLLISRIPEILETIMEKHRNLIAMWNECIASYLAIATKVVVIQQFDLSFCDLPIEQEIIIDCNHSNAPPVVVRKTFKDRLHSVKTKTLTIWGSKPIKWIRQFTYDCSTQIISSAIFNLLIYLLRVWGVL